MAFRMVFRACPAKEGGSAQWNVQGKAVMHKTPSSLDPKNKTNASFTFDHVFDINDDNKVIYAKEVQPLVRKCLGGKNALFFAYGHSGTGKSHTIFGGNGQEGIVALAIKELRDSGATVKVACIEVTNQSVNDLNDANKRDCGKDRNHKKYAVNCEKLMMKSIEKNRHCATTGNNNNSSRSHAFFKIYIKTDHANTILTIVDLAGNESKETVAAELQQNRLDIKSDLSALQTAFLKYASGQPFSRDRAITLCCKEVVEAQTDQLPNICFLFTGKLVSDSSDELAETIRCAKEFDRRPQKGNSDDASSSSSSSSQAAPTCDQCIALKAQIDEKDQRITDLIADLEKLRSENKALRTENTNLRANASGNESINDLLRVQSPERHNASVPVDEQLDEEHNALAPVGEQHVEDNNDDDENAAVVDIAAPADPYAANIAELRQFVEAMKNKKKEKKKNKELQKNQMKLFALIIKKSIDKINKLEDMAVNKRPKNPFTLCKWNVKYTGRDWRKVQVDQYTVAEHHLTFQGVNFSTERVDYMGHYTDEQPFVQQQWHTACNNCNHERNISFIFLPNTCEFFYCKKMGVAVDHDCPNPPAGAAAGAVGGAAADAEDGAEDGAVGGAVTGGEDGGASE